MHIFDDLDHQLISLLREDGRAPYSKIAAVLGISRATVQTRIDRLLESGAVLGFTLRVRQDYDDRAIRAIMMIEVSGRNTTKVIKYLRGLPELYALHTTNLSDFDRILREVRDVEGVSNSETSILLSTV